MTNLERLTLAVESLATGHKHLGAIYGERHPATGHAFRAWELAERALCEEERRAGAGFGFERFDLARLQREEVTT
jgi:hypothetical protein